MILWDLLKLFWTFFKIGACTFGGGLAMLKLAQEQVVKMNWMETTEVTNFVAISESTPGPFAVNMATYVGAGQEDVLGAIAATLGVVLPSFIVILLVARFYEPFKKSHIVKGMMTGLKPTAIGLIASAIIAMAIDVFAPKGFSLDIFTSPVLYASIVIFAISLFLVFFKKIKIPPVLIICIMAGLGIATGYIFDISLPITA